MTDRFHDRTKPARAVAGRDVSDALFHVWAALRAGALIPDRAAIDPRALAAILGDVVILENDSTGMLPYRLAGSRVCALFGHDMKGLSFLADFDGEAREPIRRALADATETGAAITLDLAAVSRRGAAASIDALLAPLSHRGEAGGRVIGSIVVVEAEDGFDFDDLATLTLRGLHLRYPDQAEARKTPGVSIAERLAYDAATRRRAAFRVLDGGKPA